MQVTEALTLARMQKRLNYWQEQFGKAKIEPVERRAIEDMLDTYLLLVAKLSKLKDNSEKSDCQKRLQGLERRLSRLFDRLRLMTSSLGNQAVIDN